MRTITEQPALFDAPFFMEKPMPGRFLYQENFLTLEEEKQLLEIFQTLPCRNAVYDGHEAQRRMVWYGWGKEGAPPDYLAPLVARAAAFANIPAASILSA